MAVDTKIKVGVLIIDEDNEKVLLIKEKYEKKDSYFWNIIKGTYGDHGSETILETAIREAKEETGAKIALTDILGVYLINRDGKTRIQFVFTACIINGAPIIADLEEQKVRNESISEIKWFSKDELQAMTPNNFISDTTYQILNEWLLGERYPLKILKKI
jgi:8-oxo-dGTP pyrophosphatase MutT (NUDIX family)